jgi:hypothetical protein
VQGHPHSKLALPAAGVVEAVEVRPAPAGAETGTAPSRALPAAVVDGGSASEPGLFLVAAEPGRYTVRARGRERFDSAGGGSRLALPPIVAPVAVLEISLPAAYAWECAGTVVVDDRVAGTRRQLVLSAARGAAPVLVLRRAVAGDEASKLLVQDDVVSFLQLRPDGLRRYDVVLYEVARGALADLAVELPPGLEVETAGTDEGAAEPIIVGSRLVVHRQRQLRGAGFLVLTSRASAAGGTLPLALVGVEPPPRARYLAVAASVPADLAPQPAASWNRVDLGDLPHALGESLAALDVTAAWRLAVDAPAATLALAVSAAAQAPELETVVRRRLTTTLLTVDGTLLHRDRFELSQAGAALEVELPAGATLWSATVDGVPVRPLARGAKGGSLTVPLGGGGGAQAVEVVAVLDRALAGGRSRLLLELAQVQAPVLDHRWRLVLPENARFRYRGGDLRPVPAPSPPPPPRQAEHAAGPQPATGMAIGDQELAKIPTARDAWKVLQGTPGVLVDRVNVGGNESGQQSIYVGPAGLGVHGRVVDPAGNPLPGAAVTLAAAAAVRSQVTHSSGEFSFAGLPPDTYRVQVELPGFATAGTSGIAVTAERGAELLVTLNPSGAQDMIVVTAESPLLDEKAIRTGNTLSQNAPVPSAQVLDELRQGLVGGVRPLPVTIPQGGKALLLAAVLPPVRITVELEVQTDRR